MRMKDRERESALYLLRKSGLQLVDAARLVLDLVEGCGGERAGGTLFERCRRAVVLGVQARQEEELSVPFAEAVEYTKRVKRHRAARTQSDISYYMRRLMRAVPWLAGRALRSLTAQDCRRALEQAYHTPSQLKKARAIMSGVFSVGRRQGWCGENPVLLVEVPALREQEIAPLPLAAVQQLVQTAHAAEHRAVLPALGLMLHAGVRPQEVVRLRWQDVDLEERQLCISPRHSKTGGARHIPLSRPLLSMLGQQRGSGRICPPNWHARWQRLRRAAGFATWVPDVLRHTFASYHIKHHHDMAALQLSMGHRDQRLLMSRYINLRGVSRSDAAAFWRLQL